MARSTTQLLVLSFFALLITIGQLQAAVLLQDDFAGPTINPAWVPGGPGASGWSWNATGAVQSDDGLGGAANHTKLTRALSSGTNGWTVDVRYGWLFGTNAGPARDSFAVLDAAGNGYAVYVDQKNGGDIGIEKYVGGAYSTGSYTTRPFADTGINAGGALTAIRLVWNPASGLELFLATAPGGNTLSATPIVSWANTDYAATTFTEFRLANINAAGYHSVFDDVNVYNDVIPEPTSLSLLGLGALLMIRRKR